jgi:hypothetical protein
MLWLLFFIFVQGVGPACSVDDTEARHKLLTAKAAPIRIVKFDGNNILLPPDIFTIWTDTGYSKLPAQPPYKN